MLWISWILTLLEKQQHIKQSNKLAANYKWNVRPLWYPSTEAEYLFGSVFLTATIRKETNINQTPFQSIQCSINRGFFLGGGVEKDSTISIIKDREFKHAWDVLLSNRKLLKQQGKGNKEKKEDPFTQHEIDILYSNNFLGGSMLVYFQAW